MVATGLLPWILGAVIALVHYFGEEINDRLTATQHLLGAFAAGVTVSYIFLQLFPELTKGTEFFGDFHFLFALIGFSIIHIAEKWIVQHEKTIDDIKKDFKELHSIFLFVYHFVIGLLLYTLLTRDVTQGILFFVPVLLHTAVSSLSLKELHEEIMHTPLVEISVSLAVLFGVAAAAFMDIGLATFHVLLGLVTGTFLYLVIHDSLPSRNGSSFGYVLGVILYLVVIAVTWSIS
jgi:hypothetical protein